MRNNLSPLARSMRRLSGLVYLLRDEFTTDDAAPITSPRTCEPGPGTLTVTDTGSRLSVSGNTLTCATASTTNDPAVYGGVHTRQSNLALMCKITLSSNTNNTGVGWNKISSGADFEGLLFRTNPGELRPRLNGATSLVVETGDSYSATTYTVICIMRSSGCVIIIDNKIIYISNEGSHNAYPFVGSSGSSSPKGFSVSFLRTGVLNYVGDYALATNHVTSPAVNETTTSEANALIEMTWTAVTGETWEFMTRRTDDNNCWIARCSQGGSTIKLIEKNAGVETERSSAAQTWTNGTSYRLVVIQDGNTIRTYVANTAKNSYTSASFNNTATGVKTNKAGSNLVTYPRTLSGAALTELQRWTS